MKRLALLLLFLCGIGWALFNFHGLESRGEFSSIVLDFREDISAGELEQNLNRLSRDFKLAPRYNSEFSQADHLIVVEGNSSLLKTLRGSELSNATEYIEPNYTYRASFAPNDPDSNKQWNFKSIGLAEAWKTSRGQGVTVAVIDTGVSRTSDLQQTNFVSGYDFVNDRRDASDDHGHGTHVAGTVAQSTHNNHGVAGIAYEAKIMPLKVLAAKGGGTTSDIAEAIRFAADNKADVINMSLGGGGFSEAMDEAIAYAHSKGVTLVAAAGNSSRNAAEFPARYNHVIAVSATGPDGQKAGYSNYGAGVDISAPGGAIADTKDRSTGILQNTVDARSGKSVFEYFQGTSMASPHVAGVAALIRAQGIRNPDQIEQLLLRSATPVEQDSLNYFGAGRLNAAAAVSLAANQAGTNQTAANPTGVNPTGADSNGGIAGLGLNGGFVSQRWWVNPRAMQLGPKLLMLGLAWAIAITVRDGLPRRWSWSLAAGVLLGSCGLFFFKGLYFADCPQWPLRLLGSSIAEWGTVFQGGLALSPITASALVPFLLMALMLGHPTGKWFAVGTALGMTGALAVYGLLMPNLIWLGASPVARIYLLVNAVLCYALARLATRSE
jgi:serine protease